MVFSVLLGALAAWVADRAEPFVGETFSKALPSQKPLEGFELRMVAFALCLLIAAILAAALSHANAIALAVGALLGAVGPRLQNIWRDAKSPDYDS